MEKKIILITGASSGLGKITASYLSDLGHLVIGTSRKAKTAAEISLSEQQRYPFMVQMDVTDTQSIERVIRFIKKEFGTIDVLINNAGIGISGSIEETPIEQTKRLFETNFFGMMRVTQNILPMMRDQQQGLIINISSVGGVLGLPFQGAYSASKFAIEGLTEALRMEVQSFGIKVVLVEPGDFNTPFTDYRKKFLTNNSVYYSSGKKATDIFEHDERNGEDPMKLAKTIETIISAHNPRLRYRVASFSQKLAAKLKGVIPDRIIQWMLMKYYNVR